MTTNQSNYYEKHFIRVLRWAISLGFSKTHIAGVAGISRQWLDKLLREKDPA